MESHLTLTDSVEETRIRVILSRQNYTDGEELDSIDSVIATLGRLAHSFILNPELHEQIRRLLIDNNPDNQNLEFYKEN